MNKLLLLIAFATGVTLYSCCKEVCLKEDWLSTSFQSFKQQDTDTVLLVRYQKGTNQTVVIDSTWKYTPVATADSANSYLNIPLKADTDWQIYIPATAKRYFLSNMEVYKFECSCDRGTTAYYVRWFELNGAKKESFSHFILP